MRYILYKMFDEGKRLECCIARQSHVVPIQPKLIVECTYASKCTSQDCCSQHHESQNSYAALYQCKISIDFKRFLLPGKEMMLVTINTCTKQLGDLDDY